MFFVILIAMSFSADKIGQFFDQKQQSAEEKAEEAKKTEISIKKNALRKIAKEKGDAFVIEVAQGIAVDASE